MEERPSERSRRTGDAENDVEQHARPEASDDVDALRAQLEEMERERTQFRNLAQRTQADFANYRRRVDEERDEVVAQAAGRFVAKLLPVMDEFKLAVEHAEKQGAEATWLEGIKLIQKKLQDILESEGVQRIKGEGQRFDPWEHEALMYQDTDAVEDGHIVAVVRDGYKIRNRVLRPAQVVVARAPDSNR